jgi:hypothetical protein
MASNRAEADRATREAQDSLDRLAREKSAASRRDPQIDRSREVADLAKRTWSK